MKNLLALAALVVITVAGAGWYLGWFNVSSTPTEGGRRRVTVDINVQKAKQDLSKGKEHVTNILNKNNEDGTPELPLPPPSGTTNQNGLPQQPPQQGKTGTNGSQGSLDDFFIRPNQFTPPDRRDPAPPPLPPLPPPAPRQ